MSSKCVVLLFTVLLLSPYITLAQTSKQELNDQFWEAVRRGDVAAVTSLLDKGADVNARFRYGTTALFKAAERGNIEIVKILLGRGADVTVKDTFYGATAMTWALQNDHTEVVSALLDKQPSSVDEVLMTGVSENKPELVKIALAKGGVKKEGLTIALAVAAADKDRAQIAELLKNAGAMAPPEISPAKLQSYVGKYKATAGMEITITSSEGRLFGAPAGQRALQLFAINETTFRPSIQGIVVQFKVEGDKVTGLDLTQGQNTIQLARVAETKQP